MVSTTYDAAMARVFADEGGYTNDPNDPGGATNFGITIHDARKYWKADATAQDVKAMPRSVASDIYRMHYAAPLRYDDLPAGVDYSILDAGINSGVSRAIAWAGRSLGIAALTISDVIAPAAAATDKVALIQKYWSIRLSFLRGLSTWSHFGKGWGRRCANGEAAAVKMWLTQGAQLGPDQTRSRLNEESAKAAAKKKKANSGAATSATTGAGTTVIETNSTDWAWPHLSTGGKIAVVAVVAISIVLVVYFVRQSIIHGQRASAYAAA